MVKSLIFCENNDKNFIRDFINHLSLNIDLFVIKPLGNKSNFFKDNSSSIEIQEVKNGMFKKVLFILDADDEKNDAVYGGFENTKKEISKIINSLDIQNISDYHIICDPETKTGYLESLLLSTLSECQKQCINNFLECSNFKDNKSTKKAKAIIKSIYKIGYPDAEFNYNHENFTELKNKLINLTGF